MTDRREQRYREKGDTWPKILRYNYEKYGDSRRAMRCKHYGIWQPYTWKDYYLNVKYLALGLIALGFEPGSKLLIIGDNAPQWYYAELAVQANRGVSVGLHSDATPIEIKTIAENSEAGFVVVQDQEQVDKIFQIRDGLPLLRKIIYWSYKGLAHYTDPMLMGYQGVLQLGQRHEKDHPGIFEQNVDSGKTEDHCALVYTSGTTGPAPKGAVHTHGTIRASADYYLSLDPWHEDDNVLPHLPPIWVTEQWFGIGCHLLSAGILNFAEAPETQQRDIRETRPSIVIHSARLWESQAATVQARILRADAMKRFAFRLLMPIGIKMADLKFQKKKPGFFLRMLNRLADIALFRPIRDSLGLSNARICYATGSTLSPDALRFYHALNLPLKSVYGTTEGGALACASNDDIRLETVGPVYRGAEAKIADNGEILYRHPGVFAGYYREPDKTAEVLRDGWFHSGDSGSIREDGHLAFLDRVRDIVVLAGGDKLVPQWLESRLRSSPYIRDAWVLAGPDRAYASAIIIINYDHVAMWAGQRKVAYATFAELSQKPEVYGLIKREIERVNVALSPSCRVKKYVNLHKEFDPDEGELTRTGKLRKVFLEERYRDLVDGIYDDKDEAPVEVQIISHDGRIETFKSTLCIKTVDGVPV